MKVVVATMIILIVFLLGSFMLNQYISRSCELLLEKIEGVYKSVNNEDWVEAQKQFVDLENQWGIIEKKWQLFLEHYEMDAIDVTMARLKQYIKIEERVVSLGELAELKLLIGHIEDKEAFKLENVF